MMKTCPDRKKIGATSATGATALFYAAYSVAPCAIQGATSATNSDSKIKLWHLWHQTKSLVPRANQRIYWVRHMWHLWHRKKRGGKPETGSAIEKTGALAVTRVTPVTPKKSAQMAQTIKGASWV